MAWDTEGTKRKIREAATEEFAQHGPDGTTIEKIAKKAGVNKERVYNYFGGKKELFAAVLRDELAKVAQSVPVASFALAFDGEVPDESQRREYYAYKTAAVVGGQEAGTITRDTDAAHLMLFVLSIAGWWSTVPQVTRMLCGPPTEDEHGSRRAAVVAAARRLTSAGPA